MIKVTDATASWAVPAVVRDEVVALAAEATAVVGHRGSHLFAAGSQQARATEPLPVMGEAMAAAVVVVMQNYYSGPTESPC